MKIRGPISLLAEKCGGTEPHQELKQRQQLGEKCRAVTDDWRNHRWSQHERHLLLKDHWPRSAHGAVRSARFLAARLSPALARVRPPFPPFLGVQGHALGRGPVAIESVEHGACRGALGVCVLQGGAVKAAALPALKHGEDGEEPVLVPHLELLEPVEPERHAQACAALGDRIERGARGGLHAPPARVGLSHGRARATGVVLDLDRHLAITPPVRMALDAEESDAIGIGDRIDGTFVVAGVEALGSFEGGLGAVLVAVPDVDGLVVDPEAEAAHERGLDVADDPGCRATLRNPDLDGVDRTVGREADIHRFNSPDEA